MTTPKTDTIQVPAGYRLDAQNRLVPEDQIKDIDLARDSLVNEIMEQAVALAGTVAKFKRRALGEIQAFVQLSSERYGAKIGGTRGNITLTSYDGRYRLVQAIGDSIDFDERLQAAKALIDDCITEWSKDARPELKTIVHDAFAADKKGNLATHKILSLRRIKIDDPRWLKAMEAISDAITITSSKTYIRFYQRDQDGKYQQIPMDPTEL